MEKFQNKYRISSTRLQQWDYRWAGAYFITICTQNREHYFGEISNGKMQLSHVGIIADILWHQIPYHSKNIELGAFVVMPNHIHGILIKTQNDIDNGDTDGVVDGDGNAVVDGNANAVVNGDAVVNGNTVVDGDTVMDGDAVGDGDTVGDGNTVGDGDTVVYGDTVIVETGHALSLQSSQSSQSSSSPSSPSSSPPRPRPQPQQPRPQQQRIPQRMSDRIPQPPKTIGQQRFQNIGKNSISAIIGSYKSAVTKHANRLKFEFQWQTRFYDHIIRNDKSFQTISNYIINNPANWRDDNFFK